MGFVPTNSVMLVRNFCEKLWRLNGALVMHATSSTVEYWSHAQGGPSGNRFFFVKDRP